MPEKLLVLYEDNHLLAVYKPAGLLVQGDSTGDPTLFNISKEYIREKYEKQGEAYLGLIHRLDRPVAGVVLFARTSKAAARLCDQIRNHRVKKTYWAVIQSKIEPLSGEMSGYIKRHGRKSFICHPDAPVAQKAILTYRTIDTVPGFSLVEINLVTGRHHQIRVQMANSGHTILGDQKYGSKYILFNGALALFAKSILFEHPTKKVSLTIESPLPEQWPWPPAFYMGL